MPSTQVRAKRRRVATDEAAPIDKFAAAKDGMYHCDYCHKDLSANLRVRCTVCPDFDLCLECFSVGVEIYSHENDHSYRVLDSLTFPILSIDWGFMQATPNLDDYYQQADEEMLLLEAIEMCGLGNWQRIAEHVGKPESECRQHYFEVYIEADTFPNPKPAGNMSNIDISQVIEVQRQSRQHMVADAGGETSSYTAEPLTAEPSEAGLVGFDSKAPGQKHGGKAAAAESAPAQNGQPIAADGRAFGGLSLHQPSMPPSYENHGSKGLPGPAPGTVALSEAQQTGFHTKREEFEPEYDVDAETIIAELDFSKEDPAEEVEQKLRLINIYNKRLDMRAARRHYVLSRGLLNVKKHQSVDRKRTPHERELASRTRVLARHLPQPVVEAFAEDLVIEQRLRGRIKELQQYRSMGFRTFVEVDQYEMTAGFPRKGIYCYKPNRTPAPAGKKRSSSLLGNIIAEIQPVIQAGKNRYNRINLDGNALQSELVQLNQNHAALTLHNQHLAMGEGKSNEALHIWRTKRGALLDIAALPDSEPLSQQERTLCSTERYLPAQLLAVKGGLEQPGDETSRFKIDPDRSVRLVGFLRQLQ